MKLSDLAAEELTGPLPQRIGKLLDTAEAEGWQPNGKGITLTVRLDKPDDELAAPFFITWQLVIDKETGKRSWRFWNAAAANLQSMNYRDVLTYLSDTTAIWPEPQDEGITA